MLACFLDEGSLEEEVGEEAGAKTARSTPYLDRRNCRSAYLAYLID